MLIAQINEEGLKQGINGFLGTRGSIMLDVVFLAMFAVVPVLIISVVLVKRGGKYGVHKLLQLILGIVLLVAVAAFEIDMQLFTNWRLRAARSPYYQAQGWNAVFTSLTIHLAFAVPTLVLWIFVIVQALRRFPNPPMPSSYSESHKKVAWLATLGMVGTAVTGWIFYWMAFIA